MEYYVATYKCAACEEKTGELHMVQAKAPVAVSMAAPSTVAYVITEKFEKGVLLYRQERFWKNLLSAYVTQLKKRNYILTK